MQEIMNLGRLSTVKQGSEESWYWCFG